MLAFRNVGLKMLQRFLLSLDGSFTYSREMFKEISQLGRFSRPIACIDGDLRVEILNCRFLDEWKECFPWRSEHRLTVSLYSEAFLRTWSAVLLQDSR